MKYIRKAQLKTIQFSCIYTYVKLYLHQYRIQFLLWKNVNDLRSIKETRKRSQHPNVNSHICDKRKSNAFL